MGAVYIRDEVQRLVDEHVARGLAENVEGFMEEAVLRLIGDGRAEEDVIAVAAECGAADIEVGRFTVIASVADGDRLHARLMAQMRDSFDAREI
jgi:hypothetical protein